MATGWTTDLDKKEYKNWVMVGCALNITKNGISQLIQTKMESWYQSLISRTHLHSLPPCTCARPSSKCATCTTWKMELERLHKSRRPKICWNNSDRQKWGSPTGAWEIAKVFMPTLGTRKGDITDASTTDIGGLLNVLEWCPFINPPVNQVVVGSVRDEGRNHWAHSPKQELEDAEVNTIFGHLNSLLNDSVFNADLKAQKSAMDLQDLFHDGLHTVRESEVEALHLLRQSLVEDLTRCKYDLTEVKKEGNDVKEETAELKGQLTLLDTEVQAVKSDLRKDHIDLLEARENIRQLDLKIKRNDRVHNDISELKEQVKLHQKEIAEVRQQRNDMVNKDEDLKRKILETVEAFNNLLNERHDLYGVLEVISEDLDEVASCMHNVAMELNTTKCKVASLEVSLESVKSEVKEVTTKVETLRAKSSIGQSEEGMDTLCAAPCRLQEFTGRESALLWLERNLVLYQSPKNPQGTSCCTKIICGLGGCGKTSLVVEFAWRWIDHFPDGVFWINGESDENVSISVADNLSLLKIPASTSEKVNDSLNKFLNVLSKINRPWLLVVDNADELRSPKCPPGVEKICKGPWQRNAKAPKNGHMLFTTRQSAKETRAFLKLSSDDCLDLQCFSEEEGALFLTKRTGYQEESLDKGAVDLAKELGGLPLALEQAAAYISALPIPCTFKDYLDKYQNVKLRLLEQQPVTALSVEAHHRLSVHTTWEMNFEFVAEKSPAAAAMMRIASFLESENIPLEVINPGFPELDQVELRDAANSEIDVAAILKVLTCYSLFSVDQQNRVFSVHKLVQEVVRESLTAQLRTETLVAAMRVLLNAFLEKGEGCLKFGFYYVSNWVEVKKEDQNTLASLLLNFRKLKDHLETEINEICSDDETLDALLSFVDRLIGASVSFRRLHAEFSVFRAQVQRNQPCENPDITLQAMLNVSISKQHCSDLESYEEAKKISEETVEKLRGLEKSGRIINHDIKYRVLEHSASYYALQGQWEKNYKALLEIERMSLKVSSRHAVELQMLIGRAENYVSACNFNLALKRQKNALKLAREIQRSNPELLVNVLQLLASLLYKEGKVDEAKPYAEEIVEICKSLPEESLHYIRAMTSALEILSEFDHQTSEDMLLNILKAWWPQVHKSVMNSCVETSAIEDKGDADYLAQILEALQICWSKGTKVDKLLFDTGAEQQKLKQYLTIGQILLEIRKGFYGEIHPMLTGIYQQLSRAHRMLGNVAGEKECFELSEQCEKGERTNKKQFHQGLPPCNSDMYRARELNDRGDRLVREQNYYDAMRAYTEALSMSPNDAKVLSNRAAAYLKLSEQQTSAMDKRKSLQLAFADSQSAIKADPSWMKGYFWTAVCLAHLGKRGPSLAMAAVAQERFPSDCSNIPTVVARFGSFDLRVVTTVEELQTATEKTPSQNLVILVKEGRYRLQEPLTISERAVMVGVGDVQLNCPYGVPLKYDKSIYIENIILSPTVEFIQTIKEEAKVCLDRGRVDEALALYNKALATCPNNPKILTSKAIAFLKSAQQQNDIPAKRESSLQLGLNDAEAAIKADPCWLLGYHTKAIILAELGRNPEAMAAAAVFKHLSLGRDVSEVTEYCGELQVHVVESSNELRCVFENVKQLEGKNQVVLLKEGEYLLERSVDISKDIVIVGHGKVSVACKLGARFHFKAEYHVENVEIPTDCESQEESQDFSSNDTEPRVIKLYQGLPTVNSNNYGDREIRDRAKSLFKAQDYYAAAEAYSEALRLSPNDAKLLTNRAASYHKSSEQKCSSPEDKQKMLEQALVDSQKAITVDPSWAKGYYRKAVSLALLGRRGPSLATAAIARHLFPLSCTNIPIIVDHFGDYYSHVVNTKQDLQTAAEKTATKAKKLESKNKVVLIKEGEYLLERSVDISEDIVIVGHGKVSVACKTGAPFHFKAAYYIENVEMATDCDSKEESQDCSSNDTEPEVMQF